MGVMDDMKNEAQHGGPQLNMKEAEVVEARVSAKQNRRTPSAEEIANVAKAVHQELGEGTAADKALAVFTIDELGNSKELLEVFDEDKQPLPDLKVPREKMVLGAVPQKLNANRRFHYQYFYPNISGGEFNPAKDPVITVCSFISGAGHLHYGVSFCSKGDFFLKRVGRKIAEERLVSMLDARMTRAKYASTIQVILERKTHVIAGQIIGDMFNNIKLPSFAYYGNTDWI